jgi:hypothetical protein
MFRTSKCSSSGRLVLYMQFHSISLMHPYKQSGLWQDVLDIKHILLNGYTSAVCLTGCFQRYLCCKSPPPVFRFELSLWFGIYVNPFRKDYFEILHCNVLTQ